MPVQVLSAEEREAWSRFPERIEEDALGTFFTLRAGESQAIRRLYGDQNRLAVALQACALRWLGFIPDDLWSAPGRAVSYLAEQLDAAAEVLTDYRALPRTRSEHARVAQRIARFRAAAGNDLARLHWRLLQAALEHDSPLALLREACRWLRSEQIVRPGLTVLERTVSAARMDAERATHRELQAMLDGGLVARLEALLLADVELSQQGRAMTRLAWLAQEGKSGSRGVVGQIAKLVYLRAMGADGWDLSGLNPNRRRYLAQLARRSTNQALQRRPERVRHPSLVAFCADQAANVSDEVVDLFDEAIATAHGRARRRLIEKKLETATSQNEKVRLLVELLEIVLDPAIPDAGVRKAIWEREPREVLAQVEADAKRIVRPADDNHYPQLDDSYSHVRTFAPRVLEVLASARVPPPVSWSMRSSCCAT